MKLSYKIVLVNLAIAIVITAVTLITASGFNSGSDTAIAFGLVCLGMGLLNLLLGIIMLISKNNEWGKGMLLSSAVLLLLCGISCGSGLSGMKF